MSDKKEIDAPPTQEYKAMEILILTVARDTNTSHDTLARLAGSKLDSVRLAVAQNSSTSCDLLAYLMRDMAKTVKRAARRAFYKPKKAPKPRNRA